MTTALPIISGAENRERIEPRPRYAPSAHAVRNPPLRQAKTLIKKKSVGLQKMNNPAF